VRPLDVPEVLVVEIGRERDAAILERADRPVLALEERAVVAHLGERLLHEPARRDRRRDRVAGRVDRAFRVEVRAGEVEPRVAEDQLVELGLPEELGAEHAHRLRVRAPVGARLDVAHQGAQLGNEAPHAEVVVAALGRVQLVPQVPREQGAAASPPLGGEGEAPLHELARVRADDELAPVRARAAVALVVRVAVPAGPLEERVVRREQDAHPRALAHREQVVPQAHHGGHEAPRRPLEEAVVALRVLEHEAQHGHAPGAELLQVRLHAGQVAAAEEARELGPGDALVGADGSPRSPVSSAKYGEPAARSTHGREAPLLGMLSGSARARARRGVARALGMGEMRRGAGAALEGAGRGAI
jgi:hypothetical protein